mgnify:FL=1
MLSLSSGPPVLSEWMSKFIGHFNYSRTTDWQAVNNQLREFNNQVLIEVRKQNTALIQNGFVRSVQLGHMCVIVNVDQSPVVVLKFPLDTFTVPITWTQDSVRTLRQGVVTFSGLSVLVSYDVQSAKRNFTVVGSDNASYGGARSCHPYVNDIGTLCAGSAADAIDTFSSAGAFPELVKQVEAVLKNPNGAPYRAFMLYLPNVCSNCGAFGELSRCQQCGTNICQACKHLTCIICGKGVCACCSNRTVTELWPGSRGCLEQFYQIDWQGRPVKPIPLPGRQQLVANFNAYVCGKCCSAGRIKKFNKRSLFCDLKKCLAKSVKECD